MIRLEIAKAVRTFLFNYTSKNLRCLQDVDFDAVLRLWGIASGIPQFSVNNRAMSY